MPDLLPFRLDTQFRPGESYVLRTSGGPAGWLADYVFSASLGGDALSVVEDGDDLVITISAVITTANETPEWAIFELVEATAGVVVMGRWFPSLHGAVALTAEVPIVLGSIELPLTLLLGPAGVGGGGGDYLLHDQTTPTASITVTHNFGRRPVVSVLLGETEVDTDVEHVSVDAVSFVFPSPTAFKAILTS